MPLLFFPFNPCCKGYAYYHFSGTKKVIDNAKAFKTSVVQAKDKLAEKTPEPRVIIQYLRSTAKAYAGFIPGSSGYVDATMVRWYDQKIIRLPQLGCDDATYQIGFTRWVDGQDW